MKYSGKSRPISITNSKDSRIFVRVQLASIAGSAADYGLTILLASVFSIYYVLANFFGNLLGGTLQFMLCKHWAFQDHSRRIGKQFLKFFLVFAGNLFLSAGGVFLLTNNIALNYVISKTITSILLGLTYNYILQKKFVFVENY